MYAAYLYDAVMVYAHALHDHLQHGGSERDGKGVMKHVFRKRFKSRSTPLDLDVGHGAKLLSMRILAARNFCLGLMCGNN